MTNRLRWVRKKDYFTLRVCYRDMVNIKKVENEPFKVRKLVPIPGVDDKDNLRLFILSHGYRIPILHTYTPGKVRSLTSNSFVFNIELFLYISVGTIPNYSRLK